MKAWQLDHLGGTLRLNEVPMPEVRPGSVLVRMEASALMSYLKDYVEGKLTVYKPPNGLFTPGGNGVGTVHSVGRDVWHLKPGERVVVSSQFAAGENVPDPAQFLIGVTAFGAIAEAIQADWADGTLAEYALLPKTTLTPIEGLDQLTAEQLALTMRFIVPYGGLLRGRLAAGETLVVSGASGAYGGAAVLLALAIGAARVIATGRNLKTLEVLAQLGGSRVVPVILTGDIQKDAAAIRSASSGGAQMAFDMVGGANDPNSTLAALHSLRRGGRLVLMGSMNVPFPLPYMEMMSNNWEVIGNFMYPVDAYLRLFYLIRSGLLNVNAIKPLVFSFASLPEAMEAASKAHGLECVVIKY
jgi:alcohol dehydrogenase